MHMLAQSIRSQVSLWADKKTPWASRGVLFLGVIYFIWPFDIIPDHTPYFGRLDDVCVAGLTYFAARMLIPAEVIEKYYPRKRGLAGGTKNLPHDLIPTIFFAALLFMVFWAWQFSPLAAPSDKLLSVKAFFETLILD
jgi:uncharacterized membrane protein YkvA (DUF1232 family)